jgi:hypothetical protein
MAFGQQTGPPASGRQVEEITVLLEQAGYESFREARHIYGLTQRQASGKFTQDEAVALIDRLQSESPDDGSAPDLGSDSQPEPRPASRRDPRPAPGADRSADRRADRSADRRAELLAATPAEELADELVRRGWMCMPPA